MLEVFVDFDGTITDVDTFDALVRAVAGDAAWDAIDGPLLAGEITLREALARQAAAVRLSRSETLAFMEAQVAWFEHFIGPFNRGQLDAMRQAVARVKITAKSKR